jgi:hypothetical protein
MKVHRPLAALFFYEALRLLLLVVFLLVAPPGGGVRQAGGVSMGYAFAAESYSSGAFFPYVASLSANALFPLMALFAWLKPEEYRSYLTLYTAGKLIAVVSFFAWAFFSVREFPGVENLAKSRFLYRGGVYVNFADMLSVWGAWAIKKKSHVRPPESDDRTESGGV